MNKGFNRNISASGATLQSEEHLTLLLGMSVSPAIFQVTDVIRKSGKITHIDGAVLDDEDFEVCPVKVDIRYPTVYGRIVDFLRCTETLPTVRLREV